MTYQYMNIRHVRYVIMINLSTAKMTNPKDTCPKPREAFPSNAPLPPSPGALRPDLWRRPPRPPEQSLGDGRHRPVEGPFAHAEVGVVKRSWWTTTSRGGGSVAKKWHMASFPPGISVGKPIQIKQNWLKR